MAHRQLPPPCSVVFCEDNAPIGQRQRLEYVHLSLMERWTHLAPYLAMSAALSLTTCKKDGESQSAKDSPPSSPETTNDPIGAPGNVAEPPADAERTPSGLASIVLKQGTGVKRPGPQDRVKVHYTGWTKQGEVFDSSHTRSLPATFALSQVIKGWTEGLQLMVPGERRRFWIPANLAYGDNPSQPGTPAGQLTFDIELLEIIEGVNPPPTPDDVASPPENAQRSTSGLASVVLEAPPENAPPDPHDRVQFHYTGWTQSGRQFDSSLSRRTPAAANLFQVRPQGLREALSLMSVGEKRRFWIPAALAFEGSTANGQPSGQLTYDIEMIRIVRLRPPPPVPPDVKQPPPNAKRTPSGLAYRVLKPGTGKVHPQATSTVEVAYAGWTTDGELFDSSTLRGRDAVFRLDRVIKGWTEGVQLMTEGEKTRFWVPADLAYGATPNKSAPSGMLVFDIELVKIRRAAARLQPASKPAANRTEALASSTAGANAPPAERGESSPKVTRTNQ